VTNDYYQLQADECRRWANQASDPVLKDEWLALATAYDELARRYELKAEPKPAESTKRRGTS
jgi:hypothetical protein